MVLDDLGNPSGMETDIDITWGFSFKEVLCTLMNVLWETHMLPVSILRDVSTLFFFFFLRDVSREPVQVLT